MPTTIPPPCSAEQLREHVAVPLWAESGPSYAAAAGLSRRAAYSHASAGSVPTVRVGGRVLVPVAALLRLLGAKDSTEGQRVSP